MKAVLINAVKQSCTLIDIEPGLQPMYDALSTDLPRKVDMVESPSVPLKEGNVLYVDEEALLFPSSVAFKIAGRGPFIGNGLILGLDDEGDSKDTTVDAGIMDTVRFYKTGGNVIGMG